MKLSGVRIGGNKSEKQLIEIENITKFQKSREEVVEFYNDYFRIVNKAAYDPKHGKGLSQTNASKIANSICTSKSR